MKLKLDRERLTTALAMRPRMIEAVERFDVDAIAGILLDPKVRRVEFGVGLTYRVAALGGAPVANSGDPLKLSKKPTKDELRRAVDRLLGMNTVETLAASGLTEFVGTYAGRDKRRVGQDHVFRLLDGSIALLCDVDVIAWERT